jgi:hypothetical protein
MYCPPPRHRSYILASLILLVSAPAWLQADEVFKSVDADGHVVYSDHADPAAQTTIVHLEDTYAPPHVMHWCWANCFTLVFEEGLYRRADGTNETWTVDHFTPTSFLLHRHDAPAAWNGFSTDVTYEGRISNGLLVDLTVAGRPATDIQAAWGAALETLPGSNAERDQRMSSSTAGIADAEVRTAEAPPPLQDDIQTPCPYDGYIWTPGYWAWNARYFWVRGAWMPPPRTGVLWTPGYWGFAGGVYYVFHPGYWAPQVGYYGGINYGFGYAGSGFAGGRWVGTTFAYNRAVSNLNSSIVHNTYDEPPIRNPDAGKVSYNGGPGGTTATPTPQERAVAAEPHIPSTPLQRQYAQQAVKTPTLAARADGGHPAAVSVHRSATTSARRTATSGSATSGSATSGSAAPSAVARTVASETPNPAPSPTARPNDAAVQTAAPKPAATVPARPSPR